MGALRILIIEDNDLLRKMVRLTLTAAGYEVVEANSGKAGLARYRKEPTDLVITDILMPDTEGLETIRELRRYNPPAKIIAMSGSARSGQYLEMAAKFGAQMVLEKPIEPDQLLAAISNVLGEQRSGEN
jgi:CheY-like chemotaxis protein